MWLMIVALALQEPVHRVLPADKIPDDPRLGAPHHVDRPHAFAGDFAGKAAWENRAARVREQVLLANGLWPMPAKEPLKPVIHGKIDRDAYTIEKVYFASLPGHYVSGNLYRPKGREGKLPAVLCPHGHWNNGRFYDSGEAGAKKEMESGAEKTVEGARYPLQARCAMLARMGCVVFFYDMVGYADSQSIKHTHGFEDAEAELRLQNFMGLQTWNSIRALDFVTGLPDVDPARVAVTGASGGGTQTFILGAVDPRPAVSFPAVMVSTKMQGGCICENATYLRVGTNNIELAALFAPKPQAMTGAKDWTDEIETKGLPELRKIYALYGAADKVHAKHFAFPHNYNQVSREMMYGWVNAHLKLGAPSPVEEKPFVPVPPAELSVFGDRRPADEVDAATLRKTLTAMSDASLAEPSRSAEAYRKVVGAALRAMVGPEASMTWQVDEGTSKNVEAEKYVLVKAMLTREDGARLPGLALISRAWNGTIVLWAHAEGKAGLFGADGAPVKEALRLVEAGASVVGVDLFLTGEFHPPGGKTPAPFLEQHYHKGVPCAAYMFGYNRPLLARRVADLASLLKWIKGLENIKEVHLVGTGAAGPWALLACALAGDSVDRAAIDLNGFDFDQVKEFKDEMMLPGALKYGGIVGFAPLITSPRAAIFNPPARVNEALVRLAPGVTVTPGKAEAGALIDALLK